MSYSVSMISLCADWWRASGSQLWSIGQAFQHSQNLRRVFQVVLSLARFLANSASKNFSNWGKRGACPCTHYHLKHVFIRSVIPNAQNKIRKHSFLLHCFQETLRHQTFIHPLPSGNIISITSIRNWISKAAL